MRLSNTPPKGAGKVQGVTKTDTLIKHVLGLGNDKFMNPIGIRTKALSAATGIPANCIQGMLTPAVNKGILVVCKITPASGHAENEYRKGAGVPPPVHKPLNTKTAGIAASIPARPRTEHKALMLAPRLGEPAPPKPDVGQNSGSAASVSLTGSASTEGRAVAKKAPAPTTKRRGSGPASSKAPACDEIAINIDHAGTVQISTDEGVLELNPQQSRQLGHFMTGTERVWNPF